MPLTPACSAAAFAWALAHASCSVTEWIAALIR